MKLPTVVIALGLWAALAGCSTPGDASLAPDPDTAPDPLDGVWCGDPAHEASNKVYVNIRFNPGGMPSASPGSCTVKRGSEVTWRGPQGSTVEFELDFPAGPPGHGGLEAEPDRSERYKVVLVASEAPGTYKYGIAANGKHVDPDLKIKPN